MTNTAAPPAGPDGPGRTTCELGQELEQDPSTNTDPSTGGPEREQDPSTGGPEREQDPSTDGPDPEAIGAWLDALAPMVAVWLDACAAGSPAARSLVDALEARSDDAPEPYPYAHDVTDAAGHGELARAILEDIRGQGVRALPWLQVTLAGMDPRPIVVEVWWSSDCVRSPDGDYVSYREVVDSIEDGTIDADTYQCGTITMDWADEEARGDVVPFGHDFDRPAPDADWVYCNIEDSVSYDALAPWEEAGFGWREEGTDRNPERIFDPDYLEDIGLRPWPDPEPGLGDTLGGA